MAQPIASLSLDLDNKWAYLRASADGAWAAYPSYLPAVSARVEGFLHRHGLRATIFVVGKDLERPSDRDAVGLLAASGHEIGNHSQNHYPWLAGLPPEEAEEEVAAAEHAIEEVTGRKPIGFRAPGFSWSKRLLALLAGRGYQYDASFFPTSVGPAASLYSRLLLRRGGKAADGADHPPQRFASIADAFRTLRPHRIQTACGSLVEAPVTTMPLSRLPIHVTYLTHLAGFSNSAATAYLRTALRLCRIRGVGPSMLLHPLDFLGPEDEPDLAFFPGMKIDWGCKERLLTDLLDRMQSVWRVTTVAEHCLGLAAVGGAAFSGPTLTRRTPA